MPKGRSRHLNMKSVPKLAKRDRYRPWLDQFIPKSPERATLVKHIQHLFWTEGVSKQTLSQRFNLPLPAINKLCKFRLHHDPCPKHDGSGLLPCSPSCRGCAWEADQILKLGPAPPAMSDRILSSVAYRS